MQKILMMMVVISGSLFTNAVKADPVDIQFERAYLAQTMRQLPKECEWAQQTLEVFDTQVGYLEQIDSDKSWVMRFNESNRPIVVNNMNHVCRG